MPTQIPTTNSGAIGCSPLIRNGEQPRILITVAQHENAMMATVDIADAKALATALLTDVQHCERVAMMPRSAERRTEDDDA